MTTDKPLAWTVEIESESCVVFAPTRAKAKWIAISAYWEAWGKRKGSFYGGCKGSFPRAKAYRASCYDNSRLSDEEIQGLGRESRNGHNAPLKP